MSTQPRTSARAMESMNVPVLPGPHDVSAEESSGSSEDRVRKFQKTTDHGSRLRKTSASNAISAARQLPANNSSAPRGRNKVPLGPRERPQDFSKQRIVSGASVASVDSRSFLPTLANEATTTTTTAATRPLPSNPRFSFSKQPGQPREEPVESTSTYDFLPSVNFDDFANSLAYEPNLSDFPAPGTFKSSVPATTSVPNMQPFVGAPLDARPTRSNSFIRRFSQSTSRKPSGASTTFVTTAAPDTSSMPPPATNMAVRTRRQSQFPAQAPPNPAARAPRKSVGPGMLPTNSFEGRHDLARLASDTTQSHIGRSPSLNKGSRRETLNPTLHATTTTTTTVPKPPNATRTTKAKSFHPPSTQQSGHLAVSSLTPDPSSMPHNHARSPGRSPAQRTHTPSSSSSKRQSTAPHISGLGARTISPTDARRLRRLSMNPNPPGGPVGPPTPQGDPSFEDRAFSQSPAVVFGQSMTPSSARATPEQNRKSFASGISLSSNSSLNSLKINTTSIPLRPNPNLSSSRLPTPKPRNVHSSAAGEEEEVPPVPAIPKAYESPKDPERNSFAFSTTSLKMSMPPPPPQEPTANVNTHLTEPRHNEGLGASPAKRSPGSIRHRRGLTVGSGSEHDRTPTVQHSSKKNLQPIRLPPLNLLPLGTPFNNRISSFPVPAVEGDERNLTPPPQRATNKTPSTPMTASKALFFSKSNHQDQYDYNKHLRSSSSAFNLRATESSFDGARTMGAMPIPTLNPTRQATTPFASNSLPKGSGEFSRLQTRPSGEYRSSNRDVEMQNMTVAGSRLLQKKDTSDSAHTSTSTEPETPSSGSSLRRKLSLSGWRRASSKAATHPSQQPSLRKVPQKAEETEAQPPRRGDMPPPRLPASATWSGAIGTSPTPVTTRTRPSLDFGRRKTSTVTIPSDTDTEKAVSRKTIGNSGSRTVTGFVDQVATQSKPNPSILTPVQRMLGSKSSSNMLKARNLDANLDRDDLLADEEMKKLASKRKDFEHAARDLDDLRKRAKPQDRVTPAQALQMVNLNIFERGEIIDYKEVYFCGTKNAKKHVGDLNAQTANFGYDDDRGDYNIVLGDHLAYRYEVVDLLGKGSFGQVVRCIDHKTGGLEAIKIIRNKKRFHQQALVEVNILQKLREWDPDNKHSMINFTQSFYFRGHLCISTELLGMNLYEFIKAHEFKGFSLRLIRRFSKQMLASLVLLKTQKVIHCDLKPENILLAHPLHSEIKVIDFGSSCFETEKVYTYIQSRFYRSPEVILGMSYGLPIDMWSLGCILAELLTGYPIFPGENEQEQLACIMEIFGPPEKHLIEKSSRKKLFFDSLGKPRVTVSTKGRRRRPSSKTLQQALKCDDEAFLDFITRCLRWDPERRLRPEEAMQHEFITGIRKGAQQRRPFNGTSSVSSPVKRIPPSQTPQARVRPLPEPPATSFKNGAAMAPQRDVSNSSSPVKAALPQRRHSTIQGGPPGAAGTKRSVNGAPLNTATVGSGLPRAAQRSASGKPDLASAAAIASLKPR